MSTLDREVAKIADGLASEYGLPFDDVERLVRRVADGIPRGRRPRAWWLQEVTRAAKSELLGWRREMFVEHEVTSPDPDRDLRPSDGDAWML